MVLHSREIRKNGLYDLLAHGMRLARAFPSRCLLYHKRESQRDMIDCKTLRSLRICNSM